MEPDAHEFSALLASWRSGDRQAGDRLMALSYDELRRLVRWYIRRERPDHTLQPTALVHELYLRLFGGQAVEWHDRAHFFAVAGRQLRRMLVDHARAQHRRRRGGQQLRISLSEGEEPVRAPERDVVALDDALQRLEALDPRLSRVVELRFFCGSKRERGSRGGERLSFHRSAGLVVRENVAAE